MLSEARNYKAVVHEDWFDELEGFIQEHYGKEAMLFCRKHGTYEKTNPALAGYSFNVGFAEKKHETWWAMNYTDAE